MPTAEAEGTRRDEAAATAEAPELLTVVVPAVEPIDLRLTSVAAMMDVLLFLVLVLLLMLIFC